MSELTLQLPDEVLNRLRHEAERRKMAVTDLAQLVLEDYLDMENVDDDDEQILNDLRGAMRDALAGKGTSARAIIDEIRREIGYDANNRSQR